MKRSFVPLLAAAALLIGGAAGASEQSKRLTSRGLVEYHAGRYGPALALFDRAVEADPADLYARYYRGVTRGRLDDFAGAIADLRAALAANPNFDEAALELGVALVETGAYQDALPWLAQAQRVAALDGQASLMLGLAYLRLGQTDPARANFARAGQDPQLQVSARYYQGVTAYQARDWAQAQAHFASVAALSPDSEMGREAARFLERLRAGERPAYAAYQVYGALGFQYDSNVLLAPSEEVIKDELEISKQADGRATINAGGTYVPWGSEAVQLSVGYEFYQSLHFDLTEFNLQDHRPGAQLAITTEWLRFGLLGRYDYYLLKDDSFLQEGTVVPWVTIPEQAFGRTELLYRMRRRDFFKEPFSELRDAFNHSPGVRQVVYLGAPDRYVAAGYQFDREDPVSDSAEAKQFAYDGHEAGVSGGWTLPGAVATEVSYAYRREEYDPESAGRRDEVNQVIVVARRPLGDHLALTGAYFVTLNESNDARFDYDRHIVSLALEARY